ncbi:MAG: asparagine synthetase B [Phycisphaerae bacterium]|nr:MAG: asparagine synthetase B [Phycisphaerae bacterium]
MCGIAGIFRIFSPGVAPPPLLESIPEAWLDLLDDSIKHRGPDGQGRFRDRVVRADGVTADVAFVHRRLSILDHAGGAQPMVLDAGGLSGMGGTGVSPVLPPTADSPLLFQGSSNAEVEYRALPPDPNLLAVAFNGCLYNHRELRRELQAAGHTFHTDHSDTEVLLHGWRAWGEGLYERLHGMFALMLWDRATGTMARARDLFGEKPLYTHHVPTGDGWINVYASVPPGATGLLGALPDPTHHVPSGSSVADWVRFGWGITLPTPGARAVEPCSIEVNAPTGKPIPDRATAEQLAELVPPRVAHRGPLTHDGVRVVPHRDTPMTLERLEDLLDAAVRSRLEADVPLGVFLSGGIDSSLIAHYARKALGHVRTFTVRMPDAAYDESGYAEEVARILGTDHTTLECGTTPAEDLVHLIETLGLPFGDSSLLPAYWVCREARKHVTVALSGDGGDELFLGYDRYTAPLWLELPRGMFGWLASQLQRTPDPKAWRARAGRMIDAAGNLGYYDLVSIFPDSMLRELIPDTPEYRAAREHIRRHAPRTLELAQSADLVNYLPEDLLRKTDTASMAVALEVRCPFLDPTLAVAALSAPVAQIMPGGRRKGLLRDLARRYLPASIVDRPKMGFAIPIGEWFRSDYGGMKTLLLDHLNSADAYPADLLGLELNRTFIQQMITEHMSSKRDHAQRLYMLLVLGIWCRWLRRLP